MNVRLNRLAVAALFAILFVLIGWVAPAAYASYAPQEQYIEVHNFTAPDTTIHQDTHHACFDRSVYRPHSSEVFVELYAVNEETRTKYRVDMEQHQTYFEKGRDIVVLQFNMPDQIESGEYRYKLVSKSSLANGRVERVFSWKSDTFTISDNITQSTSPYQPDC